MAIETDIFDSLFTIFTNDLTWPRHIEKDSPFVSISDIGTDKMPLVQFFWLNTSVQQQQRGLSTTTAPLRVEIIAKSTKLQTMTQSLLFQYKEDVINAISANIGLSSIPGFINFNYTGVTFDIHSFQDFYVAQIDLAALFQIPFGSC